MQRPKINRAVNTWLASTAARTDLNVDYTLRGCVVNQYFSRYCFWLLSVFLRIYHHPSSITFWDGNVVLCPCEENAPSIHLDSSVEMNHSCITRRREVVISAQKVTLTLNRSFEHSTMRLDTHILMSKKTIWTGSRFYV